METLTLRPKSDRRAQPRIPPHDIAPTTPEPGDLVVRAETRRAPTLDHVLSRLRAEFLDMPGLRLTLAQAQRLCGVERALCQTGLKRLVEARFLCVGSDGHYARVVDDTIQRQSATADVTTDPAVVKAS